MARDDELDRALAAFDDDSAMRGVVLVGESGVGKSMPARALAEAVEARGATVCFALGSPTGRDVPLGAFSRAVTVAVATEPAAMLAVAQHTLRQAHNLVVVADDAPLLDPVSATLLHRLAAAGTAQLIVVVGSGEEPPGAVQALLKEHWLLRLRVAPFTREQTARLTRTVLDGAVETRLVDDLYRAPPATYCCCAACSARAGRAVRWCRPPTAGSDAAACTPIQLFADGSGTVAGVVRTRRLNGLLVRAFTEQLAAGGVRFLLRRSQHRDRRRDDAVRRRPLHLGDAAAGP